MSSESPTPDQQLDILLREWSSSVDSKNADLEGLGHRIVDAAVTGAPPAPPTPLVLPLDVEDRPSAAGDGAPQVLSAQTSAAPHWRWMWALGLVVVLIAYWASHRSVAVRTPRHRSGDAVASLEVAGLRDSQLAAKRRLLNELNAMFDRRIAWFAETQGRLEFALRAESAEDSSNDQPAAPLVVRLVLQSRDLGESHWHAIWTLDVVAQNEQLVRLPAQVAGGAGIELWVYRLPDGMIHVDSRVDISGDREVHLTGATLLREGRPDQFEQREADGAEYRLYQVATVLGGEAA